MVRVEVIRKRLNKLDEYLEILYRLQRYTFEEFIGDAEHYGSAERFLHLSIEATLDMGNHVISDLDLGTVNWYSDIPLILEKHGYINKVLKDTLTRMIGFRNTLIHEYIEIDRKIVYRVLQDNLGDIEQFKGIFAQFL